MITATEARATEKLQPLVFYAKTVIQPEILKAIQNNKKECTVCCGLNDADKLTNYLKIGGFNVKPLMCPIKGVNYVRISW